MTLEQIRMFVTVAERGSIALAAQQLHKTQPAISIAIKRLQEEFNLSLLQKTGNRLRLSEHGLRLLPHCQYLLRQQEDLISLTKHLSKHIESRIELLQDALSQQYSIYDAAINTQRAFPHTELLLTTAPRLGALQRIIDDTADIAITPWTHSFHELSTFDILPFGQFEVIAVIHRQIQTSLKQPLHHSRHLHDTPLLMPQAFDADIDIEKVMGIVPAFTIRTNDTDMQKALLMKGAGWGYIPRDRVVDELEQGELIELKLSDVTCNIRGEISAVRKLRDQYGQVNNYLWDQLKQQSLMTDTNLSLR